MDIRFINGQQQSILWTLSNKLLVQWAVPHEAIFFKGFETFQVQVTRERKAGLLRG